MSDISYQQDRSHQQQLQDNSVQHEQQQYQNDQFQDRNVALQQDNDFFQIYGMFFCGVCKNMMEPLATKGQLLQFRCKRCGNKLINFKYRQQQKCMIYSKSLQAGSKKTFIDHNLIFDQSMPRMTIQCPQCSYHEAVYLVVPGDGQRKIVVRLLCARGAEENVIKCDNTWDLDQDDEVYENAVITKDNQKQIEEQD